MSADRDPIVTDGEANLGRHATLFHAALGPLDRATGRPEPVGGALFRASDTPTTGAMYVEYTAERLEEAWEETLFEGPLHADEMLNGGEGSER